MKNIYRSIITLFAAAAVVASCDMGEFGDINVNPNSPSTPYTNMLFTNSCFRVPSFVCNSNSYDIWMQAWNGYISESKNNQYGPMQNTVEYGTGSFYTSTIRNLNYIIELNTDEETKNATYVTGFGSNANQIATCMTLRAFYMMHITDIVGPLPYSEAWKGDAEDIWQPKFDTQAEIYAQLDKELVEAYAMFDESSSLLASNDVLYGGNISKWKKLNATLRMMMAIKMAEVDPTAGQSRFAKAYNDGGMVDVADSFTYTFDVKNGSSYALWQQEYQTGGTYNNWVPNETIVELLKEYKDPRLFLYCGVDGYKGPLQGASDDFNSYKGVPFGLETNDAVNSAQRGCANIAPRYFLQEATYGVITTARCLLVEAEAAVLGWINADASKLYEAGIRASFDFELGQYMNTSPCPEQHVYGMAAVIGTDANGEPILEASHAGYEYAKANVDSYIASVPLSSDKKEALNQIVLQRYLAGFMTDAVEQWSDWRRYNIPEHKIYPGQELEGITVFPYRMKFGSGDKNYNTANYQAALKDLSSGDERWSRVWWDVADNVPGVQGLSK